jgi:hypothetical protein
MAKHQDAARLVVSVRLGSGPRTFPEVELAGTRAGLQWLAECILKVANAEQEIHTHLDAEACTPVYVSPEGWWLTIERNEQLCTTRQPDSTTQSHRTPVSDNACRPGKHAPERLDQ